MTVTVGHINGTKFEVSDGMWGPILTIQSSRDGLMDTKDILLKKEDLQNLAKIFQKAADHPRWFIDDSIAQGDFDAVGRPDGGVNLDYWHPKVTLVKHKFKFERKQKVMVYAQVGNKWEFLPAVVIDRILKESDPNSGGNIQEMYDVIVFDERFDKKAQSCDFYVDRLYAMDESLVPRANLIEETI